MQTKADREDLADREATKFITIKFGREYSQATLSKHVGFDRGSQTKAASWLEKPEGFLVFLGNKGIAKTYFLAACCRHFYHTRPGGFYVSNHGKKYTLPPDICKHTEKSFYAELKSHFDEKGDVAGYGRYMAECDIFILDELGKAMGTEWQCEQLFDLIDTRYSLQLPTLIASNFNRKEIESHYGERYGPFLCSRLFDRRNCILEDFQSPDIREVGL